MNDQNLSAMFDTWLQFTLDNPLYIAAIAASVFIITALLFSLRTGSLKKQLKLSETARLSNEKTLSDTKLQLQDTQHQLTTSTAQVEDLQKSLSTEKQRAVELAQHISERNDKITATVEKLATHFETGERPAISADFKAEELWQQHDSIVEQLVTNLKTVQHVKSELENTLHQEKTKAADIETRLNSLQSQLDSQTQLISTLQSQNNALHQQYTQSQHALTEALQKQAETVKPVDNSADNLKNLFKKTTPTPEPVTPVVQVTPEPIEIKPEPVIQTAPEPEVVLEQTQPEETPASTDWYQNIINKPAPETPKEAISAAEEKITKKPDLQPSAPKPQAKGFKSVFNTKKPEIVEEEDDEGIENIADRLTEKLEKTGIMKGLLQKFSNKDEQEEQQPAPKPVKKEPKTTGFKSVFSNKKTEVVEKNDDDGLEDIADKLTEKLEKFTRLFSKKDED